MSLDYDRLKEAALDAARGAQRDYEIAIRKRRMQFKAANDLGNSWREIAEATTLSAAGAHKVANPK